MMTAISWAEFGGYPYDAHPQYKNGYPKAHVPAVSTALKSLLLWLWSPRRKHTIISILVRNFQITLYRSGTVYISIFFKFRSA